MDDYHNPKYEEAVMEFYKRHLCRMDVWPDCLMRTVNNLDGNQVYETINGPNLHIYLSADLEANDYIDLGKIKATKGNVNYMVDHSIDTEKYNKVLVWCVPFQVLFSYAELTS